MEILGDVYGLIDPYTILKSQEGFFITKDVEKFLELNSQEQEKQRIKRFISNTFFTDAGCIEVYPHKTQQKTIDILKEHFKKDNEDQLLVSLVRLGEGADYADQEILVDIKRVLKYERRVLNTSDDMRADDDAAVSESVSVIVADTKNCSERDERAVIFEEVYIYPTGFTVTRTKVSYNVFKACKILDERIYAKCY